MFEPVIQSVANKFNIHYHEKSDLTQILYVKLLEILPKLEALDETEALKLATVSFRYHLIDMYRKEKSTQSIISRDSENIIIENISIAIDEILNLAEEVVISNQLTDVILEWASNQKEDIKLLVSEFLNPSKLTKSKYIDYVKLNKKSKGIDLLNINYIPIYTLFRVLGLPESVLSRTRNGLLKYLTKRELIGCI